MTEDTRCDERGREQKNNTLFRTLPSRKFKPCFLNTTNANTTEARFAVGV